MLTNRNGTFQKNVVSEYLNNWASRFPRRCPLILATVEIPKGYMQTFTPGWSKNVPETLPFQPRHTDEEMPANKSWAHFVAGGIGGMTAALCTSPLDVLKTRLQSDFYKSRTAAADVGAVRSTSLLHLSFLNFRDTFQILFSIPRVEGWRALFKGLGPTLTGVVPASAIKFYAYGTSKSIISKSMNEGQEAAWVHLLAAAAAGLVVSTATNPIWLIKTRLQLDKSRAEEGVMAAKRYKNSLDCTLQVIRQEGIRGLYRGLSASYLGVTESTLQWILYEQMKMRLARQEERERGTGKLKTHWEGTKHWAWKIGAAGSAKLFAAGITYPHEVVRTRLRQAPVGNERHKYTGLFQCFRLIWKEEGAAAMYGGMTAHLIRVVPSTAIMFGMYEVVLQFLGAQS